MKQIFILITSIFAVNIMVAKAANFPSRFLLANDLGPKVQQSNPDDIWSEVKVDVNWLLSAINSRSCAQSQKSYLGCVVAVQTFAEVVEKNLEVIPINLLNGRKPVLQATKIALVEVPAPNIFSVKDAYGFFEKKRKELSQNFFAASTQFVSSPNADFENLILALNQKAVKPVKASSYVQAAGKFLEVSVDPHTTLQPTKAMQMSAHDNGTSFVGIGIEMMPLEQGIMVRRVMKGSGAGAAGIQAGDIITAVEGKPLAQLKQEDVVTILRGVAGSKVTLTIQRGSSSFNVKVTRSAVVSAVVSSDELNYLNKKITYIRLGNFMYEKACDEIAQIIAISEKNKVEGYVLDLRNNPGGSVKIASCLAGLFIGNKKLVAYFEQRTPFGSDMMPLESDAKITTNKPLSVLINAYSASASELVAGAFRDYNRAVVVGQTSFGKGSHQGCGALKNQPSLTICSTQGLFFAPSGISNQTIGITPHVSAFINKTSNDIETFAMREEQMYLFPLETRKISNVPASNWNQMKVPSNCMKQLNLESAYDQAPGMVVYFKDYQLLNSLAAVSCAGMN